MNYFEYGKEILIRAILYIASDIEGIEKSALCTMEKELNEMPLNELINEFGFYYEIRYNK